MTTVGVLAEPLAELPLVAILRGVPREAALRIAEQAVDAGVRCLEITVETAEGRAALAAVAAEWSGSGLLVGAGTVTSASDVATAGDAGAAFAVSPGLGERVVTAAAEAGLPLLPGVATATEAMRALDLGLTWVKAFPAAVLTPAWVRAMAGPLPALGVVATGGVTPANAREFLAAGCVGVGVSVRTPDDLVAVAASLRRSAPVPAAGAGASAHGHAVGEQERHG